MCIVSNRCCYSFFFFNDTATTEIYTLSLHDALPICARPGPGRRRLHGEALRDARAHRAGAGVRSEEHTSELQSLTNIVCRLLLEKKKTREYLRRLDTDANSLHHASMTYTTESIIVIA